jgi:hypothetical protein
MTKPQQRAYRFVVWTSILLGLVLAGCSKNGANDQGEIFIKVVDAPANYQQINIVVDRVSVHQSGASPYIWTYLSPASPISFNLLTLVNGHSIQLAFSKVPAGTYDQIKIEYGTCTIITNGNPKQLNLDASVKNGNTIPYGFQIANGQQFQLTFDYDAFNSVNVSGVYYYFKPRIRVQNTVLSGSITGTVRDTNNVAAPSKITTFTKLDSVTTYNDTTYGSFQLSDLPEDTSYTVIILPNNKLLMNDTIRGIDVVRQTITNLGVVQLKDK